MPSCVVSSCKNFSRRTKGTGIKYFSFPKDENMAKLWLQACHSLKKDINLKTATICSKHFEAKSFEIPLRQRLLNYTPRNVRNLKPDAVPSVQLPYQAIVSLVKTETTKVIHEKESSPGLSLVRSEDQLTSSTLVTVKNELNKVSEESELDEMRKKIEILERQNKEFAQRIEKVETNIISKYETALLEMRDKIICLEKDNCNFSQQIKQVQTYTSQKYEKALAKVFTPNQVKKLLKPFNEMMVRWTSEDIELALELRNISHEAYKYLLSRNYPFPPLSTLRRKISKQRPTQNRLIRPTAVVTFECDQS